MKNVKELMKLFDPTKLVNNTHFMFKYVTTSPYGIKKVWQGVCKCECILLGSPSLVVSGTITFN